MSRSFSATRWVPFGEQGRVISSERQGQEIVGRMPAGRSAVSEDRRQQAGGELCTQSSNQICRWDRLAGTFRLSAYRHGQARVKPFANRLLLEASHFRRYPTGTRRALFPVTDQTIPVAVHPIFSMREEIGVTRLSAAIALPRLHSIGKTQHHSSCPCLVPHGHVCKRPNRGLFCALILCAVQNSPRNPAAFFINRPRLALGRRHQV